MSIQCSVFIATSLDGFISRENGSIDWLMKANPLAPAGEDCGYKTFISTVDAVVMGRNSFEMVLSFDPWPYGDLSVIVLSSKPIAIPNHLKNHVSSSSETPEILVNRLAQQGFKHLYIDGGITIQGFIAAKLINEITLTLIPVLLGTGRPLFGAIGQDISLNRIATKSYDGGFVQLKYIPIY